MAVTIPTIARTEAQDLKAATAARKRILKQRTVTLSYWRQRDQTQIPVLKAQWLAEDKAPKRKRFDLICEICSRPFSKPRQPHPATRIYCPACAHEIIKRDRRDHYWANRDTLRQQKKESIAWLKEHPDNPRRRTSMNPAPPTPKSSTPAVVWSPEADTHD